MWLFNCPVERKHEQEADSRTIVVDIPDHVAARHEWLQERRSYRKLLIPAGIANGYLRKQ
jgi:hypothetical protein